MSVPLTMVAAQAGSLDGLGRRFGDLEQGAATLNLPSGTVQLAAEIADFEPHLSNEQRLALMVLIIVSLAALEEGSTRFPVTGATSIEPMLRLIAPLCGASFGSDGAELMRLAIAQMLTSSLASRVIGDSPDDYKPLIYLAPFIYHHRSLLAEMAFARRLALLMSAGSVELEEARLCDVLNITDQSLSSSASHAKLSEEQRAAIKCAAKAPLTIISGGPGTGKTSIVVAILKVLAGIGVDPSQIALAAPTGKAAYRVGESIRQNQSDESGQLTLWQDYPAPGTVHRLLGYSPARRRFRYHRNNPLDASVVIVDEGSMLDLELISRLLDAMRPDARLIILGDADQLPSVSAGSVFRDLLAAVGEPGSRWARSGVRLTRSYRAEAKEGSGHAIFRLAAAIKAGEDIVSAGTFLKRRDSAERIEFVDTEWLEEEWPGGAFLERWYSTQIRPANDPDDREVRVFTATEGGFSQSDSETIRDIFARSSKARILCVTRVLDSGTERINSMLHRRLAHDRGIARDLFPFMVGEPVMMLHNDYERMLFNGDQGVVLRVSRAGLGPTQMAVFPRGDNFIAFPVDALRNHLELCYAMTVHKAQGSEFDTVAVIMPKNDIPILSREVLYTAVSRARESVILVGAQAIIEAALGRMIERYSGVAEHLAKFLEQPRQE